MDGYRRSWQAAPNRFSEASFGKMVFHGNERPGEGRRFAKGGLIDGLDAVEIDHPDKESFLFQFFVSPQSFVERCSRGNDSGNVPFAFSQDLTPPDEKLFFLPIEDRRIFSRRPDIDDAAMPGRFFNQFLGGYRIGRI